MSQLCRKQVEEVLLATKGIVSFTFDMKAQRSDVRARVDLSVEVLVICTGYFIIYENVNLFF